MKKFLSLLLVLITLPLSLLGCNAENGEDSGQLKIIATIFPQYDFARQIGKDRAEVSMLIPPGAESHSFEPTISDIMEISECDIFIYTGGESDSWLDRILESVNNPDMTVISLVDCVDTNMELVHSEDSCHHSHHNSSHVDEHVWTSPVNAIAICEKICEAMSEKDTANADFYEENTASYTESLYSLDKQFREITQNGERDTLVFGDRFPLLYFAEEYGLHYHSAFSGCSEDTEASASAVAGLIDIVREENIPVVFTIELSNENIARTICEETGAKMMTFYSCHNISKEDFDGGETYLSLFEKNAESLKVALG